MILCRKKRNGPRTRTAKVQQRRARRAEITERLHEISRLGPPEAALQALGSSFQGLSEEAVEAGRERYGDNVVTKGEQESLLKKLLGSFVNPFTVVLIVLAVLSYITDVWLAAPAEKDPMTVIIILVLVLISGILQFVQEARSGNAAAALQEMIKITTAVERVETGRKEMDLDEVVVGDIIHLAAGDMIPPADLRILRAKDLFVSQAALTGESEPVEKLGRAAEPKDAEGLTDIVNLAFMGTDVVSGGGCRSCGRHGR